MIKRFLFASLLLTLGLSTSTGVFAQTGESGEGCAQAIWMCANMEQLAQRKIRLTASGVPTNTPIYVACGIPTKDGWAFTTGSDESDKALCMGDKNATRTRTKYQYDLKLSKNPVSSTDGNLDVTVTSTNIGNATDHSCMLAWFTDVGETSTKEEAARSLQYETFGVFGAPGACMSVRQDPYGRVFDASTLKPLPNADVTLLDQNKKAVSVAGVNNPITTAVDGMFNFLVEAGTYFLTTTLENAKEVHKNATLAYSNIYTYDTPIVEAQGAQEQRDIPVNTTNPANAPRLELVGFGTMQLGQKMRVQGKASWPLTQITVKQGETELASGQADKFGSFSFDIANSKISANSQLTIVLTEVDLTADPSSPAQGGSTVSKDTDPIPTYLEGYAKTVEGSIIPFATVKVKLTMSDSVYYQTSADEEGFFTIPTRFLPIISYYLEFTPANSLKNIKATIPVFASQNSAYHEQENINIITGTKKGTAVDPILAAGSRGSNQAPTQAQAATNAAAPKTAPARSGLAGLFFIVFIIVLVGVAIVVYIKIKGGSLPGLGKLPKLGGKTTITKDTSGSESSGTQTLSTETENAPPADTTDQPSTADTSSSTTPEEKK